MEEQNVAVTANQARLRMRAQVVPMSGQIEEAADQIMWRATPIYS